MGKLSDWTAGFRAAWELLIDLPLPGGGIRSSGRSPAPVEILVWFPLLGAAAGAVVALIEAAGSGIFNHTAGMMAAVAVGLLFCELKDSGRGSLLLASFIAALGAGAGRRGALEEMESTREALNDPLAALICLVQFLFKAALLGALAIHGVLWWMAAVFAGEFLFQGVLLLRTRPEAPEYRSARTALWTAGIVVGGIMLPAFPAAVAVTAALLYIGSGECGKLISGMDKGRSADGITLTGTVAEIVFMLIGLLLL